MWGKENNQNQTQLDGQNQQPDSPNLSDSPNNSDSLNLSGSSSNQSRSEHGTEDQFEEAVKATEATASDSSTVSGDVSSADAGGAPQPEVVINLIGRQISLAFARYPFAQLAKRDHPAWMPKDEDILPLADCVSASGNELLNKFLPQVLMQYAQQFPRTAELLMAFIGALMAQSQIVAITKVMEARLKAAKPVDGQRVE